ncbi:4-hydroxyphenylpyruvate dioxygenase-like protein isoform X2 [Corythoichthys intestinalis]|uniref:4-hydroxyphenylpyruvate dioxygenase-like protein isoform X2 n=1 Tax=Corythoichthys intestinalis TaxID=161448 RepID=UPI0025A5F284|nr:4-hydroxyphenylpyruvate dioxygenase-like protein isoform X2 [Corythoichthys intestinalis]
MAAYVRRMHHVSLHVSNVDKLAKDFTSKFKFNLIASRLTERTRQLAFRTGAAVFVVNERTNQSGEPEPQHLPLDGHQIGGCLYDIPSHYPVDTVCNVCFEVDDVNGSFEALRRLGCSFPVPPTTVRDHEGQVTYAVLRSTVPDGGPEQPQHCQEAVTHMDHITYACPTGTSQQILRWYQQLFGFQRFFIHRNDMADSGLVIDQNGIGLRLAAMEYWKCGESGLSLPGTHQKEADCKFVLAESLPEQGSNQVNTFLKEHRAAGIQHIGLYTGDIVAAVRGMADAGVHFFSPPAAYYSEVEKLQEIEDAGQDAQQLARLGILLDSNQQQQNSSAGETHRYLLQVFSKPIFAEDTFFLELIQRKGASGFGEGNIRALWKSVQVYMDGEKAEEAPEAALQQSR